jgi:hypothetical protein
LHSLGNQNRPLRHSKPATNPWKPASTGFVKTEREWAERAARHLKPELQRVDLTYEELPDRLKKHGFKETKALGQPTEPTILGTASEDDDEAAN